MTLRKSDKIIAIIGVIILIIAGIGIVLYATMEEEEGGPTGEEGKELMFRVVTNERTLDKQPDNTNYEITPKILGQGRYTGTVELSQQNLKNIEVTVKYRSKAGFFPLLGRIKMLRMLGRDTLTVKITDETDAEVGKITIRGDDNKSIIIDVGPMIMEDTIIAEDQTMAEEILAEKFIDYQKTYTITASLKTGLWGKIRERLTGKHSFELQFIYTYYGYEVEPIEPDEEPPGIPPTEYEPAKYSTTNYALTKH